MTASQKKNEIAAVVASLPVIGKKLIGNAKQVKHRLNFLDMLVDGIPAANDAGVCNSIGELINSGVSQMNEVVTTFNELKAAYGQIIELGKIVPEPDPVPEKPAPPAPVVPAATPPPAK